MFFCALHVFVYELSVKFDSLLILTKYISTQFTSPISFRGESLYCDPNILCNKIKFIVKQNKILYTSQYIDNIL